MKLTKMLLNINKQMKLIANARIYYKCVTRITYKK